MSCISKSTCLMIFKLWLWSDGACFQHAKAQNREKPLSELYSWSYLMPEFPVLSKLWGLNPEGNPPKLLVSLIPEVWQGMWVCAGWSVQQQKGKKSSDGAREGIMREHQFQQPQASGITHSKKKLLNPNKSTMLLNNSKKIQKECF